MGSKRSKKMSKGEEQVHEFGPLKTYYVVIDQVHTYGLFISAQNEDEAKRAGIRAFMRRWAENDLAPSDKSFPEVVSVEES